MSDSLTVQLEIVQDVLVNVIEELQMLKGELSEAGMESTTACRSIRDG